MFSKLPTTVFGFVAYNIFAISATIFRWDAAAVLSSVIFSIPLPSGAVWAMSYGDIFICLVMVAIFLEIVRQSSGKISKPQTHMLSLAVFIISLLEFLMLKAFGNSIFFIFLLATHIDFVTTWLSTMIRARRDLRLTGGDVGS